MKKTRTKRSEKRGQMTPFKREQIAALRTMLSAQHKSRDLALLNLALDTMLRSSDLVRLRVSDVIGKDVITVNQKKTGESVSCVLSSDTITYLQQWIGEAHKGPEDFIFTRLTDPRGPRITEGMLRIIVKGWATMLGLDASKYSGHSLRRTKASLAYGDGIGIEHIRQALGHTTIAHTQRYLGVKVHDALEAMRKVRV